MIPHILVIQDAPMGAALAADPGAREELDDEVHEQPEDGQNLKHGWPELEKDMAPSALLVPANRCFQRHLKKLEALANRFTAAGKSITDLQQQSGPQYHMLES